MENRIPPECDAIRPEMLPLVELSQEEIERIVREVSGGVRNVQDIYPLTPLQEGILFHHRMGGKGDPYVMASLVTFPGRAQLDKAADALQAVVDRHDILRTGVVWEGLREPVQVVWRKAVLPVQEEVLDPELGDVAQQLYEQYGPQHYRLDMTQAPLLRLFIAEDKPQGRWLMLILMHHLAGDHRTLDVMGEEVEAHLLGRADQLSKPQPFRELVVKARMGMSQEEHEAFFREMLGDVEEPTLPFGLMDVRGDGTEIKETRKVVERRVAQRIREQARRLGVSAASVCYVAWAQMLGKVSGKEDVVFGTVLFGRMGGGEEAEHGLGLFMNTLPMRVHLGMETAERCVRRTHKVLAELLRHEHTSLALAQKCSGVTAPAPLFSALLNYRNARGMTLESGSDSEGLEWKELHLGKEDRTNYPFSLTVDFGEEIGLWAQTVWPVDPERVCGYMGRALESLVEVLNREPGREMRRIDVLPAEERWQVLLEWNRPQGEYRIGRCVHEWFEEQVERTPGEVAVVFQGASLTYAELNRRANQLAHYLRKAGVKADRPVGMYVERSLEMVIGILGVLKAGGAYVPLDQAYPEKRLQYMLEDSAPVALLMQGGDGASFFAGKTEMPVVDLSSGEWQKEEEGNLKASEVGVNERNLAYVIYTSGSTGQPKGVMVEHGNVTRLFKATEKRFDFGKKDVWTLFHSYAFDFSVWELWGALLYGGRLIVVPRETARSAQEFYSLVCREEVTILNQTPSAFRQLVPAQRESGKKHALRQVIFGGEALEVASLRPWYEGNGNRTQLVNMYGATETTVHVTYRRLEESDTERGGNPIGKRIPDVRTYILDEEREPAPVGAVGELYIGGAGLARGYSKRADLTAERFMPDPYSGEAGARMYKTGDVGKWLADGTIEFVGRNDRQVKIRGYRIELGEVEARLREHEGVRDAVVVHEDRAGNKRLIAYVVPDNSLSSPPRRVAHTYWNPQQLVPVLRVHLLAKLPEYMVPAAYVLLEALPLTPNGKLDRKRLPAPEEGARLANYEAPVSDAEGILAGIWKEVLKVGQVGRRDNFFELGGDSLLAMRVMERMRQQRLFVDVRALLNAPTLAELALAAGKAKEIAIPENRIPARCNALTPEMLPLVQLTQEEIKKVVATVPGGVKNVQDIYPLAPLQEGMLFHHLMGEEGDPYLSATLVSFDNRERLDGYLKAMQAVIDRHDILRTGVVWEGLAEPVQVVWRKVALPVQEVVLKGAAADVAEQLYQQYGPQHYRMDTAQAPLLRVFLLQDKPNGRWLMLLLMHHLVGDQRTVAVLEEEVEAHVRGQAAQLPDPQPFRNLVAQARLGVSKEEHERFFRQMLGDVGEPTLPFGLMDLQGDWSRIKTTYVVLEKDLSRRIQQGARKLGVSAAALFHTAWAQVLAKVSGREDVVFGTVLVGRMGGGEGAKRGLGLFINTLPIRLQVGNEKVEASVRETQRLLAELIVHEHASLALAQKCSGVPAPTPSFSALLNFRGAGLVTNGSAEQGPGRRKGIEILRWEERTNYPLTLLVDFGEEIGLLAQTASTVDPMRVCGYMKRALESLMEAVESGSGRALRTLEMLPEAERQQVLLGWNRRKLEYRNGSCVHELFEEHVEKTPDKVAVEFEDQQLTYGELNRRANQLAHYLRKMGVQPERRVAFLVDRSVEMVVGVLAVLKAGGSYVPLDPGAPAERITFMLEDIAPALLLKGHAQQRLPKEMGNITVVDLKDPQVWQDHAKTNLDRAQSGLTSQHPAYVIYTSGSTGKPKGVVIEHRGVCNQIAGFQAQVQTSFHDRVLQFAAITFDASVEEIFSTLLAGARLTIRSDAWLAGAQQFWGLVRDRGITLMDLPTRFWTQIVQDAKPEIPLSVRQVMIGGEAVERKALVSWFEREGYRPPLWNSYGPTEVTVNATLHAIDSNPGSWNSIGGAMANVRLYVLDANLELAPIGVVGELYIAGDGLARGYWNRPELTAERFPADPFAEEAGARMYKTGDLVRWLEDGTVGFVGRNDFQVKIRGFRIELEEIQGRLTQHPGVREVVVIAREEASGEKRLVAYYTVKEDQKEEVRAEALRAHLAGQLPEYMVPAAYMRLEKMPLTSGRKLDRKALPAPEAKAYVAQQYQEPADELEKTLAEIWTQVLHVEKLGRHDDFFKLGGHSLLAMRLTAFIRNRMNYKLSLVDVFQNPTIAAMTQFIRMSTENASAKAMKLLVPIQPKGPRVPFFCVHPVGGQVACYANLSRELGPDQPLFGIQSAVADSSMATMEEIARAYNKEIRQVQPHGPYFLGGWSLGGLVAWEMARQLSGEKQKIGLLALIDSHLDTRLEAPASPNLPQEGNGAKDLSLLFHLASDIYRATGKDFHGFTERYAQLDPKMQWQFVLESLERDGLLAKGNAEQELTQLLAVFTRNLRAAQHYRMQSCAQDIVLIRAADMSEDERDWARWTVGKIDSHTISGNHYTILRQPAVVKVAEIIGAYLNRASKNLAVQSAATF